MATYHRAMALRKRREAGEARARADIGLVLAQGYDLIEQSAEAHHQKWGFGSAQRWDVDQSTATIRWTFPDKHVEAPVQILGSFSPGSGTWMWSWANDSIVPQCRAAAEAVKVWGEANSQAALATAKFQVPEEQAAELAVIAFRLSGLTGFYKNSSPKAIVYMAFGPVTITPEGGQPETFTITLGP